MKPPWEPPVYPSRRTQVYSLIFHKLDRERLLTRAYKELDFSEFEVQNSPDTVECFLKINLSFGLAFPRYFHSTKAGNL